MDMEAEKELLAGTLTSEESQILAEEGLYALKDISLFMQLILQRYGSLTVYIIEPYIEQNVGEALKIPAGDNYSIYDYGGRLAVTANDIFATPLFSNTNFLLAIEQLLQMLTDAGANEIAILGDLRGKNFMWDRCERLKAMELSPLTVINFTPADGFIHTREAVLNYLRQHGMTPTTQLKPVKN